MKNLTILFFLETKCCPVYIFVFGRILQSSIHEFKFLSNKRRLFFNEVVHYNYVYQFSFKSDN